MNANDPNFGILLLFGAILCWGLAPDLAPAVVILLCLWGLGTHPIVTILILVAWFLRWLVADFFLAFVAGLGGGLGLRASGFRRGRERDARLSLRDRWRARGGRFR